MTVRPWLAVVVALGLTFPDDALPQTKPPLSLYGLGESGRAIDPNGFLWNPTWRNAGTGYPNIEARCRFRVGTGNIEERTLYVTTGPCLSDTERGLVTLNETATTLGFGAVCSTNSRSGSVKGHVNWFPVTATGLLRWNAYSSGLGEDHDLTMELLPPDSNALTSGNGSPAATSFERRAGYHIEFYAEETLARLKGAPGFWEAVRRGLRDKKTMHELLDRRVAVVTGLYGLDGVHGLHAELHPVYSLAILLDATTSSGKRVEHWAFMVRNLGNEGDCSSGRIPMPATPVPGHPEEQRFVVDLGWWKGATLDSVWMAPSWSDSRVYLPELRAEPDSHLYLGFRHTRPVQGDPGYLFIGTILVEWKTNGSVPWIERFASWLPRGHGDIKLNPIEATAILNTERLLKEAAKDSIELVKMRATFSIEEPAELVGLNPARLGPIDSGWLPASEVRKPEPAIPWLVVHRVGLECQRTAVRLSVCSNGWRWMLTPLSHDKSAGHTPSLGVYLRPRGSPALETGLGDFGRILGIFGYRWELRRDRFVTRGSSTIPPRRLQGPTLLLLSPIWEPVTARLSQVELTPYTLVGTGLSFLDGGVKPNLTLEFGTGLQAGLGSGWPELFFEVSKKARRKGGVSSHTSVSAGFVLAGPFFKDYGRKQRNRP